MLSKIPRPLRERIVPHTRAHIRILEETAALVPTDADALFRVDMTLGWLRRDLERARNLSPALENIGELEAEVRGAVQEVVARFGQEQIDRARPARRTAGPGDAFEGLFPAVDSFT